MSLYVRGKGPIYTGVKPPSLDPFWPVFPLPRRTQFLMRIVIIEKSNVKRKKEKKKPRLSLKTPPAPQSPQTNPLFRIGIIKTSGRRNKEIRKYISTSNTRRRWRRRWRKSQLFQYQFLGPAPPQRTGKKGCKNVMRHTFSLARRALSPGSRGKEKKRWRPWLRNRYCDQSWASSFPSLLVQLI